jgi:hypothetical protein
LKNARGTKTISKAAAAAAATKQMQGNGPEDNIIECNGVEEGKE